MDCLKWSNDVLFFLALRHRTMGCDGGSIPKRCEMVTTAKKAETATASQLTIGKWFFCQLSKQQLQEPVVADLLGRLYNKSAILEYLLSKTGEVAHITGLKSVKLLNLKANSKAGQSCLLTSISESDAGAMFICPISLKEMNGKSKFSYLPCGCVLANEALDVATGTCLVCSMPFTADQVVLINPETEQEIEVANARLRVKKSKKRRPALLRESSEEDDNLPKKKATKTKQEFSIDPKKKQAGDKTASINMIMPDLKEAMEAAKPINSNIESMYFKKDIAGKIIEKKNNWLSAATFNRYNG